MTRSQTNTRRAWTAWFLCIGLAVGLAACAPTERRHWQPLGAAERPAPRDKRADIHVKTATDSIEGQEGEFLVTRPKYKGH